VQTTIRVYMQQHHHHCQRSGGAATHRDNTTSAQPQRATLVPTRASRDSSTAIGWRPHAAHYQGAQPIQASARQDQASTVPDQASARPDPAAMRSQTCPQRTVTRSPRDDRSGRPVGDQIWQSLRVPTASLLPRCLAIGCGGDGGAP
jgi:hypothetical protein